MFYRLTECLKFALEINTFYLKRLEVAVLVRFIWAQSKNFTKVFSVLTGEDVAIKMESLKAKHPQLEYESRVYKALAGGGIQRLTLFF